MAKYQRLPGSEDELDDLEVTTVSGKLYSRAKEDVEVGELLITMQKLCHLSGQIAQHCSLFTTAPSPSGSVLQMEKIFVDQRTSTHKLSHHFKSPEEKWHIFYGFKYYPTNVSHEYWKDPTARSLFLHQLHYDIENNFINFKDSSVDLKSVLKLMNKASGFQLHLPGYKFERNEECKQLMEEIFRSKPHGDKGLLEDENLAEKVGLEENEYEYEALIELHSQISILPQYGRHSYFATSISPNSGPVILSGGYKGIFIHNINPLESEEILLTWEVINEVYYRKSKLVIKYVDSCKKKVKHMFVSDRAKIIWKIVLDHHGFFRLDKCEDASLDMWTLSERKSKFRHFCIVDDSEEVFVIGHKEKCQWGFVQVPSSSATNKESFRVDVQLAHLPKHNEYHYEIRQDSSKTHHIHPVNDRMHQCVEAEILHDELSQD